MTSSFSTPNTFSTLRSANVIATSISPEAATGFTIWGGAASSAAGALTVWGSAVYAGWQSAPKEGPKGKALSNVIDELHDPQLVSGTEYLDIEPGDNGRPMYITPLEEYHFVWNPDTKGWEKFTPSGTELDFYQPKGRPTQGPDSWVSAFQHWHFSVTQQRYIRKKRRKEQGWITPYKRLMKITYWSPTGNAPC